MGHRWDVQGGAIRASTASGIGRGAESAGGSQGVLGYCARRFGRCCSMRCRQATSESNRSSVRCWGYGWASSTPSFKTTSRDQPSKSTRPSGSSTACRPSTGSAAATRASRTRSAASMCVAERCSCRWRTRRVRRRRTFHPTNEDLFVGTPDFGEALVIMAGVECKAH
jgi:hypothetical protein